MTQAEVDEFLAERFADRQRRLADLIEEAEADGKEYEAGVLFDAKLAIRVAAEEAEA